MTTPQFIVPSLSYNDYLIFQTPLIPITKLFYFYTRKIQCYNLYKDHILQHNLLFSQLLLLKQFTHSSTYWLSTFYTPSTTVITTSNPVVFLKQFGSVQDTFKQFVLHQKLLLPTINSPTLLFPSACQNSVPQLSAELLKERNQFLYQVYSNSLIHPQFADNLLKTLFAQTTGTNFPLLNLSTYLSHSSYSLDLRDRYITPPQFLQHLRLEVLQHAPFLIYYIEVLERDFYNFLPSPDETIMSTNLACIIVESLTLLPTQSAAFLSYNKIVSYLYSSIPALTEFTHRPYYSRRPPPPEVPTFHLVSSSFSSNNEPLSSHKLIEIFTHFRPQYLCRSIIPTNPPNSCSMVSLSI